MSCMGQCWRPRSLWVFSLARYSMGPRSRRLTKWKLALLGQLRPESSSEILDTNHPTWGPGFGPGFPTIRSLPVRLKGDTGTLGEEEAMNTREKRIYGLELEIIGNHSSRGILVSFNAKG